MLAVAAATCADEVETVQTDTDSIIVEVRMIVLPATDVEK